MSPMSWVGFTLMFGLFLSGLFCVFAWTKTIKLENSSLTVRYIFRLKTSVYDYKDIVGFRWKYIGSFRWVTYKSIKIKTNSNKILTISDFEYSNLKKLEKIISTKVALRITNDWIVPNQQENENERVRSAKFDIDQAKEIKVFIIISGLLLVVSISFILHAIIAKADYSLRDLLFILAPVLGVSLLTNKFLKTNKYIKENNKHDITSPDNQ